MEKAYDFLLGEPDPGVNGWLKAGESVPAVLDRRYTQEEDFFLVLDRSFVVEPLEIHHTSGDPTPPQSYLEAVRSLVQGWSKQLPGVFQGLTWYFNPQFPLKLTFVQGLSSQGKRFLYRLQVDLTFRGSHGDILDRGRNDITPRYTSRHLFVESEVLPLETWESPPGWKKVYLAKLFPQTWTGETGRGYQVAGHWLDPDISRLLTRAALAPGFRTFPHFPFRCRFQTLSVTCPDPAPGGRRVAAQTLARFWPLVEPSAGKIQADLKAVPYHENHPLVGYLRELWGPQVSSPWAQYRIEPYLNDLDQKEYRYYGD